MRFSIAFFCVISANRIHTIYQILIGRNFVILHISCGDGVEQLFCTINFGTFDDR